MSDPADPISTSRSGSGSDVTLVDSERPASQSAALSAGEVVGRYVVLSKLGAGGMGVVYAAYDPELDRKVALKLLRAEWVQPGSERSHPTDGRARLLREAQALARFSHPEIVAVHDVGEHQGAVWVAMEFVDGRTLALWAEQTSPSWKAVVNVMIAAGRGVAAAHAAGLVHRDLKPDNIMVSTDGRVRVMDFGLTRAQSATPSLASQESLHAHGDLLASPLTQHGGLLGTPGYMAPEQFAGDVVTAASDQFAYCVTMWELLFGERPFAGRSIHELADAVMEGRVRPPSNAGRVPGWLRRVCERGLARDSNARWSSMETLLAELARGQARGRKRAIALGFGVAATLVGGVEAARRLARARAVDACEIEGGRIEEVWNDEARDRVRAGLIATHESYAEATANSVIPYIDKQVEDWREHRTNACINVEVRSTWDRPTHDRAVWCLDERRFELQALIDELARADSQVAGMAVSAAAGLTQVSPCIDERVLATQPLAPDADSRTAIAEVRAEIAHASALHAAGKIPDALAVIGPARSRAESLAWPQLIGLARQREGLILLAAGDWPAAEVMSKAAYAEAAKAGVWEVAADAAIDLTETIGDKQARHAEGRVWAQHAEIAILHAGDPLGFREAQRATNLGHVLIGAGAYDEAEVLYQSALDTWTTALGPEHPMVGPSLNNLGNVRRLEHDFVGAKDYVERSLALQERVLGPHHPDIARNLHNLGSALDELGEHEQAKALYDRALAIWDEALGPDHPNAATTLILIGNYWSEARDFDQASAAYQRALAILERKVGPEHPSLATLLNNIANVHHDEGELEQAKVVHQRALAILEKALGPNHPNVSISLFNVAMLHRSLGEHDQAKPLLERSLAITERTLGVDHPEVAWILGEIGDVDLVLGHAERGLPPLERALVIYDANPGVQGGEPGARFALAQVLVETGGDRARAYREAEMARDTFRSQGQGGAKGLAIVEAWLARQ